MNINYIVRQALQIITALIILNGCVGKTLSDTKSLEEYSLREATDEEVKRLTKCAKAIYKKQNEYFAKNKKYVKKISELNAAEQCQRISVRIGTKDQHWRATLTINEDESTVKWMVNDNGTATEELEPEFAEDFSF